MWGIYITKKVYEGIIDRNDSSNSDLYINNNSKPLKVIIQDDLEKYGNYLTVKYWISDKKLSENELDEKFMDTYYNTESENNTLYFEISEYLWKEKGCKHHLIEELSVYTGKYCRLEIDFSNKPQNKYKSFI